LLSQSLFQAATKEARFSLHTALLGMAPKEPGVALHTRIACLVGSLIESTNSIEDSLNMAEQPPGAFLVRQRNLLVSRPQKLPPAADTQKSEQT
jgi:hypothetical protein